LRFAQQSFETANRAYPIVGGGAFHYDTETRRIMVDLEVANTGQTPVRSMILGMTGIVVRGEQDLSSYAKGDFAHWSSVQAIPGGKPFATRIRQEIDSAQSHDFSSGALRFLVIGQLRYEDVFGKQWTQIWCRTHRRGDLADSNLYVCDQALLPSATPLPIPVSTSKP
jgi:hypothetical protein